MIELTSEQADALKQGYQPTSPSPPAEPTAAPYSSMEADCDFWEEIDGIEFRLWTGYRHAIAGGPAGRSKAGLR